MDVGRSIIQNVLWYIYIYTHIYRLIETSFLVRYFCSCFSSSFIFFACRSNKVCRSLNWNQIHIELFSLLFCHVTLHVAETLCYYSFISNVHTPNKFSSTYTRCRFISDSRQIHMDLFIQIFRNTSFRFIQISYLHSLFHIFYKSNVLVRISCDIFFCPVRMSYYTGIYTCVICI